MLRSAGKYSEALPLVQAMVVSLEKASNNRDLLGPDHPDVATSTSNLAYFLFVSGRTADALQLAQKKRWRTTARSCAWCCRSCLRRASNRCCRKLDEALAALQRGRQSSAASAVNKLAVRLAAGSDRLVELVRKDQDLAAESEALDKAIIAAVSKPSAQRDVATEQRSRARIAAITSERAGLQKTLAIEFPDYTSQLCVAKHLQR